ncbi:hypothetical protein [Okeania sp. SIO1I7]|uniref:hypothetical protein n=1 Tax=Okeania sp. SIO1I7 TaxID=2607772 RepID=UPI00345428A6
MPTIKKTEENTHPLPPGSFGLPLIGETIDFIRDSNFADRREQKYGTIFKTHILGRPTIVMIGPEANRFISTLVEYPRSPAGERRDVCAAFRRKNQSMLRFYT